MMEFYKKGRSVDIAGLLTPQGKQYEERITAVVCDMRTNDKHPWQLFSYYCGMNWNQLTDIAQLETIDSDSATQAILIFKHSTRCSTSSMALARVERSWNSKAAHAPTPYYLDLIKHRDISNAIATRYGVEHESPQVLVIAKGRCIFSQTHLAISVEEILEETQQL